jgi:hypothetical protein
MPQPDNANSTTPPNVTQLHPLKAKDATGAARARRFRTKKRKATVTRTVTPTVTVPAQMPAMAAFEKSNDINPSVTVSGVRPASVTLATVTAALALATVSAGFSITGMTSIFVGSFWPVIGMGIALEVGKLSAVAALPTLSRGSLKGALIALVAVLMGLNAIGAYGFLAKAHIGHALDGNLAVAGRAANVNARLTVQGGLVSDLDRQLTQIDAAVEKATSKGRTSAAMRLADDQRKTRADLAGKRITEAKALAALQVEKSAIEGERAKVEADLGPVRYLATLLGSTDEETMRWFILAVALLLDPAAVLLLLAATRRT